MSKKSDLNKEIETLREDVAKLRTDLASTSKKLVDVGKDQTASVTTAAKAKLQAEAAHLITELNSALDSTRHSSKRAVNTIENRLTERPFMSVAVALVAGLICGKLTDRN
ncbi:MAG: hypothetical protein RIG61_10955 [Deltaproteobacteria bacterium]